MNIESALFKVTSAGIPGLVNVMNKRTNDVQIIANAPMTAYLAAIPEKQFDKECASAMKEGRWTYGK